MPDYKTRTELENIERESKIAKFNLDLEYQKRVLMWYETASVALSESDIKGAQTSILQIIDSLWGRLDDNEKTKFDKYRTDVQKESLKLRRQEAINNVRWDFALRDYRQSIYAIHPFCMSVYSIRNEVVDLLHSWLREINNTMVRLSLVLLAKETIEDISKSKFGGV